MRLVFLTNVFPSQIAPTKGTFNLELVKELARHHELAAVVPVAWTDRLRARWQSKKRVPASEGAADGFRSFFPTYWFPPRVGRSQYATFLNWSIGSTLRRLEREFRPEAVLGYWAHPDGAVAVEWARKLGVPGWIMVGGSDVLLLAKNASRGAVIRLALHSADGVIAVSRDIAQVLTSQGIPPNKVHVVYRGVDSNRFVLRDKPAARRELGLCTQGSLLVWVGRMVEVKGLEFLLTAAARARSLGANFQLALIGNGPLRKSLEVEVERLRLSGNIRFVGSIPHASLAAWYQAADWTLLSSLSEGVPNVLLESHACGTPFIATAVGGVPEIAVAGLDRLVSPRDIEALASAICAATTYRAPPSEALRSSVSTIESAAEQVAGLLQSAVPAAEAELVGI